jgi:hypothetical protein
LFKTFTTALLGVTLAVTTLHAQGNNFKNGQDLTGTWRIRVTIPPGSSACPAGPAPCVFLALANANSDGTAIQTAALPDTSTGHGVWVRTGLRTFRLRTTYFRLDGVGFPIGTAETESLITLDQSGTQASGSYENKVFDLNQSQVGAFSAQVTATRLIP